MEVSVEKMRRNVRYHAVFETVKESMNEKGVPWR
jgi:hypothetical protein